MLISCVQNNARGKAHHSDYLQQAGQDRGRKMENLTCSSEFVNWNTANDQPEASEQNRPQRKEKQRAVCLEQMEDLKENSEPSRNVLNFETDPSGRSP